MAKKFFALKLIPPRPTFAQDMTDEALCLCSNILVLDGAYETGKGGSVWSGA
jgi:hypothetical protein